MVQTLHIKKWKKADIYKHTLLVKKGLQLPLFKIPHFLENYAKMRPVPFLEFSHISIEVADVTSKDKVFLISYVHRKVTWTPFDINDLSEVFLAP